MPVNRLAEVDSVQEGTKTAPTTQSCFPPFRLNHLHFDCYAQSSRSRVFFTSSDSWQRARERVLHRDGVGGGEGQLAPCHSAAFQWHPHFRTQRQQFRQWLGTAPRQSSMISACVETPTPLAWGEGSLYLHLLPTLIAHEMQAGPGTCHLFSTCLSVLWIQ